MLKMWMTMRLRSFSMLVALGSCGAFSVSGVISRPRVSNVLKQKHVVTTTTIRYDSKLYYSVAKDVDSLMRDVSGLSKSILPVFEEELVTADSDSVNDAMQSNDRVRVFRKRNLLGRTKFIGFEPLDNANNKKRSVGFILYPGAFVSAEAYTPIARSMADLGYYAAVTVPPLELSLTDKDLADDVIQYWGDEVRSWTIGGHSMGGVVAAAYANDAHRVATRSLIFANNEKGNNKNDGNNKLKGIVLLASYPSGQFGFLQGDLSDDAGYKTLSCFGTLDGLATPSKIENHKNLLPPNTLYCPIEGGNHSQFYYGDKLQKGDNPAKITRDEQQEITRQAILALLTQIV